MDPIDRLGAPLDSGEITRAARVLWVRSRRQATSLLAGGYASAFRGGGTEFEESRPYAIGDDVRSIDWNATARTGEPWVKRFREERSQTVLLALDVSGSMGFGTTGRTKVETAAHAAALVAAAAGRAGDQVGLVTFADTLREAVPPGRGDAHTWRVVEAAANAARDGGGATDLAAPLEWVRAHARRRSVVMLLSDFRDDRLLEPARGDARLASFARRHDLVAAVVEDPRERALTAAGTLRLRDPEQPGRLLVLGTRRRRRTLYRVAAGVRRRSLERALRAEGADLLWLSTEAEPLGALAHFFRLRSAHARWQV